MQQMNGYSTIILPYYWRTAVGFKLTMINGTNDCVSRLANRPSFKPQKHMLLISQANLCLLFQREMSPTISECEYEYHALSISSFDTLICFHFFLCKMFQTL